MEKLKELPRLYDSLDNTLENRYNENRINKKISLGNQLASNG